MGDAPIRAVLVDAASTLLQPGRPRLERARARCAPPAAQPGARAGAGADGAEALAEVAAGGVAVAVLVVAPAAADAARLLAQLGALGLPPAARVHTASALGLPAALRCASAPTGALPAPTPRLPSRASRQGGGGGRRRAAAADLPRRRRRAAAPAGGERGVRPAAAEPGWPGGARAARRSCWEHPVRPRRRPADAVARARPRTRPAWPRCPRAWRRASARAARCWWASWRRRGASGSWPRVACCRWRPPTASPSRAWAPPRSPARRSPATPACGRRARACRAPARRAPPGGPQGAHAPQATDELEPRGAPGAPPAFSSGLRALEARLRAQRACVVDPLAAIGQARPRAPAGCGPTDQCVRLKNPPITPLFAFSGRWWTAGCCTACCSARWRPPPPAAWRCACRPPRGCGAGAPAGPPTPQRTARGARPRGRAQVDALGPDAAAELAAAGVRFPLVHKPLAACGAPGAHRMAAVAAPAGLARAGAVARPALAQEFVDHGGTVHKVYVIGGAVRPRGPAAQAARRARGPGRAREPGTAAQVRVSERPSLPDMAAGAGQPDCVLFDSQRMAPIAAGAPARQPARAGRRRTGAAVTARRAQGPAPSGARRGAHWTGRWWTRPPRWCSARCACTSLASTCWSSRRRVRRAPRAPAPPAPAARPGRARARPRRRPLRRGRQPLPVLRGRAGRRARAAGRGQGGRAGRRVLVARRALVPLWHARVFRACERRRSSARSVSAWRSVRAQAPRRASRLRSDRSGRQSGQLRQQLSGPCWVGVAASGGSSPVSACERAGTMLPVRPATLRLQSHSCCSKHWLGHACREKTRLLEKNTSLLPHAASDLACHARRHAPPMQPMSVPRTKRRPHLPEASTVPGVSVQPWQRRRRRRTSQAAKSSSRA